MPLGFALIGIVFLSIPCFIVVQGHLSGEPSWLLTVLMIPWGLFWLSIIASSLHAVLINVGFGPTRVEITAHPLCLGESTEAYIAQYGRLFRSMNKLEVKLECQERAYDLDADEGALPKTRTVKTLPVFAAKNIDMIPGVPFEARFEIRIPEGAMHSFRSMHSAISWELQVWVWPRAERGSATPACFSPVVAPPETEGLRT
jgi:hypothetical protein